MAIKANNITDKIAKLRSSFYESMVLNWSPLNKSILVLLLGGIDQCLWFAWCLHAYLNPNVSRWFDLNYLHGHMVVLSITLVGFFILAKLADTYRDSAWIKEYFPYFAILYFSFVFLYGGYSVGIMSPATIAGYVSLATVGLVLFDRKIIYLTFIPATIALLGMIILSVEGYLIYAPTFSDALNQSVLSENRFWVYSMLYHYIPIFIAAIVLFEVLLLQWRYREKSFDIMSKTDPLTGIFNRRSIGDRLKSLNREQRGYAIVLLDLDHFKNINDNYGHDVGDIVLKRVAEILSEEIRGEDSVGRFGGEEFILILKEKKLQYAMEIAERCRQKIASEKIYLPHLDQSLSLSASFGLSMSNPDVSEELTIRQADEALYLAKQLGRNQVQSYASNHLS